MHISTKFISITRNLQTTVKTTLKLILSNKPINKKPQMNKIFRTLTNFFRISISRALENSGTNKKTLSFRSTLQLCSAPNPLQNFYAAHFLLKFTPNKTDLKRHLQNSSSSCNKTAPQCTDSLPMHKFNELQKKECS